VLNEASRLESETIAFATHGVRELRNRVSAAFQQPDGSACSERTNSIHSLVDALALSGGRRLLDTLTLGRF
jgi:hypothetical protein